MLFKEILRMQYLCFRYNEINNSIHLPSPLLYLIPIGCIFFNGFTYDDGVISNGEKNSR
jgi:hypothetical protein